jgi:hypothetical protein
MRIWLAIVLEAVFAAWCASAFIPPQPEGNIRLWAGVGIALATWRIIVNIVRLVDWHRDPEGERHLNLRS